MNVKEKLVVKYLPNEGFCSLFHVFESFLCSHLRVVQIPYDPSETLVLVFPSLSSSTSSFFCCFSYPSLSPLFLNLSQSLYWVLTCQGKIWWFSSLRRLSFMETGKPQHRITFFETSPHFSSVLCSFQNTKSKAPKNETKQSKADPGNCPYLALQGLTERKTLCLWRMSGWAPT